MKRGVPGLTHALAGKGEVFVRGPFGKGAEDPCHMPPGRLLGCGRNVERIASAGGPLWVANLYKSLLLSNIGSSINEHLVPIIGFVMGPFLPENVREVFG